ncbi:hypothetical protein PMZ80_004458 [Knufia obscura]|uniref:Zn(2)-C6 fungal-type domain-containing protein n=1 Tax=Knufia obscura TaxID=1635080 RepID=A0ABR0RS61_9EURO|nr:hypothetical protein PMZ80_004458 [Knufia obscura]
MSPPSPNNVGALVKPNGRLGSKKSKTGCLTCKARKVKCDEAKPVCRRCVAADRVCQGYDDVFVSTQISSAEYARNRINGLLGLQTPPRTPSPVHGDARALQYYRVKVANILGGAVDTEFWTTSVLQLSEAEPAIQQALFAVSDLWEVQETQDFHDSSYAQRRHFERYSKALTATAERVAQPRADTVALATCVLFLCLHCLRGDKEETHKLLQTGAAVMQKVLRELYEPSATTQNEAAKIFLPIFERMLVLLRLFGQRLPHFRSPDTILYNNISANFSQFEDLDEARGALYWLVAESHELIVKTRLYRFSPDVNDLDEPTVQECFQKQGVQLAAYAAWLEAFDHLCTTSRFASGMDDYYKANLLLTHTVTVAWLSTCMDRDEGAWNKHTNSFRIAVREAEKIVSRDKGNTPMFTFEMGVIPPLYLTVLKCRDPYLRWQAISILERAPAREGLWSRTEALRVCRRVVQLESGTGQMIPGGIRFQGGSIVDARTLVTTEQGTRVTFAAKLNGHQELWREWDELIPLEEDVGQAIQYSLQHQ